MKHLFELDCPHCGHSHNPSWLPFNSMALYHLNKQPLMCESCDKGVEVTVTENSEQEVITYRMWPSLTPYYPTWLFWNPDVSNPGWFRVSKIATLANPELLNDPDAHPDHLVDAREHLKTAMQHAMPYINEGRSIAVGSINRPEQATGIASILTAGFVMPYAWYPDLKDAANVAFGFMDLCTAFCMQAKQHDLVSIDPVTTEQMWNHTLTTCRVVDYMLRNPWFVSVLEATANRYYRHAQYRPIIAVSTSSDAVFFNSAFTDDIEPVWVPLYGPEYRKVNITELVELLDAELTQDVHLELAERFSPDRPVMYSHGSVPMMPEPEPEIAPVVKPAPVVKKPTLH